MKKIALGLIVLASCSPSKVDKKVEESTPTLAPTGAFDPQMDHPEYSPPETGLGATTLPEAPPVTQQAEPPRKAPSRPAQREQTAPRTTILAKTPRSTSGTPPEYVKQCESGGDYTAVNPNGHYGAWQFSQSTWNSVGGTGRPDQASPAEQDKRAAILWNGGKGASHWSCY